MKRRTAAVAALVVAVIVLLAAIIFVVNVQSPTLTNQVRCTDYQVAVIEASTFSNGSQSFDTVSTVSTVTGTANYSTTIGYTFVNSTGPRAESGTGETYTTESCTFIG